MMAALISDVTIRMGGQSGTALKVAGRHADVFELTPGTLDEIRQLMERVRIESSFMAARPTRSARRRIPRPPASPTPAGPPTAA